MDVIYLTRRNLLTLLSKLDRNRAGGDSNCAIIKSDNQHPTYPQTMSDCFVQAIEDEVYYTDRKPGDVLPVDDPTESQ